MGEDLVGLAGFSKPLLFRYVIVREMMDVTLASLTEADAIIVYETYRHDREPDSPQVAFHALSPPDRQRVVARLSTTHHLIRLDKEAVGFISLVIQPNQALNVGFGLFPAFRGQGLMGRLLRRLLPDVQQTYPQHHIIAATRLANHAAMTTLARAGFRPTAVMLMPPIGAYHEPIAYQQFSYDPAAQSGKQE